MRSPARPLIVALTLGLVASGIGHAAVAVAAPTPGAAGMGDRLRPGLGNGGYEVVSYDLIFRYATSDTSQGFGADETIVAWATQSLSQFDLDWAGKSIGAVSVNGMPASFIRSGEELIVTPAAPLPENQRFTVKVTNFTAKPRDLDGTNLPTIFFNTPDGSATAPQPYGAHRIYPCNDHPRNPALFKFTFHLPAGMEAIANGVEVSHTTGGGRTTWVYAMDQPMATELTQLAVGNWDVSTPYTHAGVVVRDVTPPSLTSSLQSPLALEGDHIDFMQDRVGGYPFDRYGGFVVNADLGFALETQTLSTYDIGLFDIPKDVWDPVMVHELSHMWFGDSVTPYSWSDIWQNEGHASWYEFTYAESVGELEGDTTDYPDPQGYPTLDQLMRAVYAHGDEWRKQYGPVALPKAGDLAHLFSPQAYHGGALVLYALRQRIGQVAFEQVERAWLQRYRGQAASTDDFIALATNVSGKDVTAFLRDWLYGTKTPPMPGHPKWTVNPAAADTREVAASDTRAQRY